MTKPNELRDQSLDELKAKYLDLCADNFARVQMATQDAAPQTHLRKQNRREVARILTIIREKELQLKKR